MKQFKATLYGFAIRAANRQSFRGPAKQGGATAIEYALIAGLIAAVIIGTLTILGQDIDTLFQTISDAMPEPDTG